MSIKLPIYIRLLIITMTERIMHSEKTNKQKTCRTYQTNKKNEQQLTDTSNECQYTCLYNIRTMKLLS